MALVAAGALAYAAAPEGTVGESLFRSSPASDLLARANPASVPTDVAGPTYVMSINTQNQYEKNSGRKLAEGTSIYDHLVEMHKPVRRQFIRP